MITNESWGKIKELETTLAFLEAMKDKDFMQKLNEKLENIDVYKKELNKLHKLRNSIVSYEVLETTIQVECNDCIRNVDKTVLRGLDINETTLAEAIYNNYQ